MLCLCSELKRRLKAQKKTDEKQEKLAAAKQQATDTHKDKAEASVAEEDIDPHVRLSACICVSLAL